MFIFLTYEKGLGIAHMGGERLKGDGEGWKGVRGWFLTIFECCSLTLPILEQTKQQNFTAAGA